MNAPEKLRSTIGDAELEAMLERQIPCGGVAGLHIPPCGSPASFVFDHHNLAHPCTGETHAADFKCVQCYDKWLDAISTGMSAHKGVVWCERCRNGFNRVSDFARYVPL